MMLNVTLVDRLERRRADRTRELDAETIDLQRVLVLASARLGVGVALPRFGTAAGGVGVILRRLGEKLSSCDLDDLAGVHVDDPVGQVGDHPCG